MSKLKYDRVVVEVPKLDSKNATFVALINEIIKWGNENGIQPEQVTHFMDGFKRDCAPHCEEEQYDT